VRSRITPTLLICIIGAVVVVVGLFLPARDVADPTPSQSASATEVSIADFAFSATSALSPGQEILVTNNDSVAHTLTATDGAFDTGLLQPGEQAVITVPSAPGDYAFFCEVHPSMTGVFAISA